MRTPKMGLLLKMLGVIVAIMIVIIAASLILKTNLIGISAIIPIGLIAFIIWKFGKKGTVTLLIFFGLFALLVEVIQLSFSIAITVVGALLIAIGILLMKKWGLKSLK